MCRSYASFAAGLSSAFLGMQKHGAWHGRCIRTCYHAPDKHAARDVGKGLILCLCRDIGKTRLPLSLLMTWSALPGISRAHRLVRRRPVTTVKGTSTSVG